MNVILFLLPLSQKGCVTPAHTAVVKLVTWPDHSMSPKDNTALDGRITKLLWKAKLSISWDEGGNKLDELITLSNAVVILEMHIILNSESSS